VQIADDAIIFDGLIAHYGDLPCKLQKPGLHQRLVTQALAQTATRKEMGGQSLFSGSAP
jgi:hypothetical protein